LGQLLAETNGPAGTGQGFAKTGLQFLAIYIEEINRGARGHLEAGNGRSYFACLFSRLTVPVGSMTDWVVFDLDDTLYDEADYAFSGFAAIEIAIRGRFPAVDFLRIAKERYLKNRRAKVIDETLREAGVSFDQSLIDELVAIYRKHVPSITLSEEAIKVIERLSVYRLAVISDGFLHAQTAKCQALKLDRWFSPIILTDRWGRDYWKPHPMAFKEIMKLGESSDRYCYIADNPRKDFVTPRKLGWWTIRVRIPGRLHASEQAGRLEDADHEAGSLSCIIEIVQHVFNDRRVR
jgi:putative hydrolase of the HAD superfamily